ncbi:uncharacterized protein LOC127881025 [Dreissena polymorpha]|uniref:Sterile alpha motif domain-containing protein 9-like n=1 Tax=Dreissena polymorpha TaxID=45954 RepID=A0A9D4GUM5_DREPO|nr:uncharacterized protein LOC127881025 [Dreissena polymorpha]KAH3820247.1 hypothetical protein DPMN_121992 [Dreissena polymorpha]
MARARSPSDDCMAENANMESLFINIRDEINNSTGILLKELKPKQGSVETQSEPISRAKLKFMKRCTGIKLISSVLNNNNSEWMEYDTLDTILKQNVKECGYKSFEEVSGMALNDFIISESENFQYKKIPKSCKKKVKMRIRRINQNAPSNEKNQSFTSKSKANDQDIISDNETELKRTLDDEHESDEQYTSNALENLLNPSPSLPPHTPLNEQNEINALDTECLTRIEHDCDIPVCSANAKKPENLINDPQVDEFLKDVNNFSGDNFVLMCGDAPGSFHNVDGIGMVPWVMVLDFDPLSQKNGLLNMVRPVISSQRSLKVSQLGEPVDNPSEMATQWCLLSDEPTIAHSQKDQSEPEVVDSNVWFKEHKREIEIPIDKLETFTNDSRTITLILLWPQKQQLGGRIIEVLTKLNYSLRYTPKVVLCLKPDEINTFRTSFHYMFMKDKFKDNLHIYQLELCSLSSSLKRVLNVQETKDFFQLPNGTKLSSTNAAWLSEDIEVLYVNKPFTSKLYTDDEAPAIIEQFYKGGTIEWPFWYNELIRESVVERTIQKEFEMKLKQRLNEIKSSYMTLYHAPGSGGSTLAQSVMWSLHHEYLCVQLRFHPAFKENEFERRMSFLHKQSGLPILLLVESDMESKPLAIYKRLPSTTVLFVDRYQYHIDSIVDDNFVFSSGAVTKREAQLLCFKLSSKCSDAQKKQLERLRDKVKKGKRHLMYEFGMAVFQHEFKGIVSFVKGHLKFRKDDVLRLTPEQTFVGFLAIAYFYGHTSIPFQFFANLLENTMGENVDVITIPNNIAEMVIADTNTHRKGNIRIRHWLVSKEILEQLLTRQISESKCSSRGSELSISARNQLFDLSRDFIEYAASQYNRSPNVLSILIKTFIIRERNQSTDTKPKQRSLMARLLTDIPHDPPLFTQSLQLFELLVKLFPWNPSFHAHLGRFYAYCRSEFASSQKCFEEALKLCADQTECKEKHELDNGFRVEVMHIYHMYGSYKSKCLRANIDCDKMSVNEIVSCTVEACKYFELSRDIAPESRLMEGFEFTDEINVMLLAIERVQGLLGQELFNKTVENQRTVTFLAQCMEQIPFLIRRCCLTVDNLHAEVVSHLCTQERKYNSFFQEQQIHSIQLHSRLDLVTRRRLQIQAKSMSPSLNKAIPEILKLYQENFKETMIRKDELTQAQMEHIEHDFLEWLNLIRHNECHSIYTIEDVLLQAKKWNEITSSKLSQFYIFICYSLLGFGTDGIGRENCIDEALRILKRLKQNDDNQKSQLNQNEWLVDTGKGIKRLKSDVSPSRFVHSSFRNNNIMHSLSVCKGTIAQPNSSKRSGKIKIDLPVRRKVLVHFVPVLNNLEGQHFAGQRVEFNLLFSARKGYEARNIQLLSHHACLACHMNLEFTSTQEVLHCDCGNPVIKDRFNWTYGRPIN